VVKSIGLVFKVVFAFHSDHLQATLSKLLTYCMPRSTQSSTLHGMGNGVLAYGLQGEGLVWLIGAVVCLHAAPQVQLFASWVMDGRIMHWGIISSCQ